MLQVQVTPLRPLSHERLNNTLAGLFRNVPNGEEEPASMFEEGAAVGEEEEEVRSPSAEDINMVSSPLVSCF